VRPEHRRHLYTFLHHLLVATTIASALVVVESLAQVPGGGQPTWRTFSTRRSDIVPQLAIIAWAIWHLVS
jgi:hypothetical protein